MSARISILLETCPNLVEMQQALATLGLRYKHSLPADERWPYPMHIFGCGDIRLTYSEGDPRLDEAIVEGSLAAGGAAAEVRLRLLFATLCRRFGGSIRADAADLDYAEVSA
jgi:hypothetical protein